MNRTHQELLRAALDGSETAEGTASAAAATMGDTTGTASANSASRTAELVRGEEMPGKVTVWDPVPEDLPSLQPRTSAAEQFRRLRSRLLEHRSQQPLQTVLLSSALPQEGKSFIAANLAVSLNQHRNTRVLLIDGDMRRYSLQRYFGSPHKPGLADYLGGTAGPDEIMQRPDTETIQRFPSLSHLCLIPGGGMVEHVADLSEDSRFGRLIDYAKPQFDWIVVDSSPVTLVSDAVNLARHCDGVMLVVRSGVTDYKQAQKAQAELQAANLIGVVLNAVVDRPAPSYYGYGPVGADA